MAKLTTVTFFGVILLIAMGCDSVFGVEKPLTPVKLQLKWKHQFQFAGYYAAIEQGYYNDFGLSVELIEASVENSPLNAIVDNSADFAIVTSDVVVLRDKGYDVVVLASIFQHSAQILLAPKHSGISHVHNLVGKKVMVEDHSADLMAYISDEGISLKQIEFVPHDFSIDALINKEVDAMMAYSSSEPFLLEKHGVPYTIITPRSGGIDFYGDVLITTEKLINEDADMVLAFREASLKGWKYAMEHQEEMINYIDKNYRNRLSKEHLYFEADKINDLVSHELVEIGYTNIGRWQHIVDIYKQAGMIDKDFDMNGLFYSDYINKAKGPSWKLIATFSIILSMLSLITLFFYRLSRKLKKEIKHGHTINQELKNSKEEILVSNERLNKLSEFKEDMTNMIVHDLKTPLSAIMNIELYANDDKGISIIKQSGVKMYNLVQNILDIYKYENSEFSLNKKAISLIEIINAAMVEIDFSAEQDQITLEINEDIKCEVFIDEEIIRRVFANILSNAVKYSPPMEKISIATKTDDTNLTKITISNQGPSIPKDKQKVIFKKFGQADRATHGNISSTGLGLAFCKMAIEAHGGEIGVNSFGDIGAEFWFTLPGTICGGCSACKA